MSTKSREYLFGTTIRVATERAAEARREADQLTCKARNMRMLGFKGPAQPSPALGDALNAGFRCLEVRCLGCDTHQTIALSTSGGRRRRRSTRYMRCKADARIVADIHQSAALQGSRREAAERYSSQPIPER